MRPASYWQTLTLLMNFVLMNQPSYQFLIKILVFYALKVLSSIVVKNKGNHQLRNSTSAVRISAFSLENALSSHYFTSA